MSRDIKDSHQEILERTGIMEDADPSLYKDESEHLEEPAKEPEPKKDIKSPKKEEAETEEESEEEDTEEDEESDEEDEDAPKEKSNLKRPKGKDEITKALFSMVKDMRKEFRDEIKEIKTSMTPKEKEATVIAQDALEDTLKKLEEEGYEVGPLKTLSSAIIEKVTSELRKQGLTTKDLPDEVKDALKTVTKISEKEKTQEVQDADREMFEKTFNAYLPALSKAYPNASKEMIQEAKQLLDEISHSAGGGVVNEKDGTIKPYEFDYLVYKNKQKFDTILKAVKSTKSGETKSKMPNEDEEIPEDDSDIDLDPENMTPEKAKAWEDRKRKNTDKFGKV